MIKTTPTKNHCMIETRDITVSFVCNGSHGNAVNINNIFLMKACRPRDYALRLPNVLPSNILHLC